jgi:D-alanine-D-alanine ligase
MGAAAAVARVADELGTPLVVKPATGGSSLGLTIVQDAANLPQAIVGAFSYSDQVLIERFVAGTEVALSLLGGQPLPPVEIQPKEGVYDFAARYTAGATEFHAPARLDDEVADRCREVALTAHAAIGARHITRADMIVDDGGRPFLLELDTCPGLTETSLLPLAARAAGLDFGELCERIVQMAIDDA